GGLLVRDAEGHRADDAEPREVLHVDVQVGLRARVVALAARAEDATVVGHAVAGLAGGGLSGRGGRGGGLLVLRPVGDAALHVDDLEPWLHVMPPAPAERLLRGRAAYSTAITPILTVPPPRRSIPASSGARPCPASPIGPRRPREDDPDRAARDPAADTRPGGRADRAPHRAQRRSRRAGPDHQPRLHRAPGLRRALRQ